MDAEINAADADSRPADRLDLNLATPFWTSMTSSAEEGSLGLSRLHEQWKVVDGKSDAPSAEDPDEPRIGGIPDQVEGCEPNNHDNKDVSVSQNLQALKWRQRWSLLWS